jgi:hypothetical protein
MQREIQTPPPSPDDRGAEVFVEVAVIQVGVVIVLELFVEVSMELLVGIGRVAVFVDNVARSAAVLAFMPAEATLRAPVGTEVFAN